MPTSDKSHWWVEPHWNETKTMKAVTNNEYWENGGEHLPVKSHPDEAVEFESHKDALHIQVNNKIQKVKQKHMRQLNNKHLVPHVPYTDEHESWMVWRTIPSRLKIRKEAKEMRCLDHFLAENYQLGRKDTLQGRLLLVGEECRSRIIWEMQRGGCFWKEAWVANRLESRWDCMEWAIQMVSPCKPDQLFSQLWVRLAKKFRNWNIWAQGWFFFIKKPQTPEFLKMT